MIEKNNSPEWTEEVKKLAGAWNNFPLTNELRSDLGFDSERDFSSNTTLHISISNWFKKYVSV